jgi:hypothetical protein
VRHQGPEFNEFQIKQYDGTLAPDLVPFQCSAASAMLFGLFSMILVGLLARMWRSGREIQIVATTPKSWFLFLRC